VAVDPAGQFFEVPKVTNRNGTATASTERACVGSLAAYLDNFAEFLI
jgi:hypothetical protein